MKLKGELVLGALLAAAAGAWLTPPPWPLGDPEARYALEARGLFLGHSEPLGEPVPVLGALLGLLLAGDSNFAVRLPGMLTGAALVALAWGLATELGRPRALGLALLWTFSPVLALAGRTVGSAAWVNLLTALGAFGLIRWAGTGRRSFLCLGILSATLLLGCGPAGWTAPGGLGVAGALSGLAARSVPIPAAGTTPPALAAGVSLLALGLGTFGFPGPTADFPQPPLPVSVLLAVYEPLPLGAWLLGLPKLRLGLRSGWPSALGVIWPLTALAGLLLPVPNLDIIASRLCQGWPAWGRPRWPSAWGRPAPWEKFSADRSVGLGAGWFWAPSCWGRPAALQGLRSWEPLGRLRPVFLT